MNTVEAIEHTEATCSKTNDAARIRAIRDALEFLGGKWKLSIIFSLVTGGRQRFSDLQRSVAGITPRMLSKELQDLEMNQLVRRNVVNSRPVTVEYEITEHSKNLRQVVDALAEWGIQHRAMLVESHRK